MPKPTLTYQPREQGGAARSAFLNTRGAVIVGCLLAFVATLTFTCGGNAVTALAVMATDGGVVLVWTVSAAALGGTILRLLGVRRFDGLNVATASGLGLGVFSLLGLGLGLAGMLNRPVAMGFMILPIAAGVLLLMRTFAGRTFTGDQLKAWLAESAGLGWVWIVPVVSVTLAAVAATILPGVLWKPFDPIAYDVLSYHLEVPREWYQLHRIVPLHHNVFSYFPFNVEVNDLLLMHVTGGPWTAMYSCQLLGVAFTVLTVIAIAGAGVKRSGVVGAAVACTAPWVIMLGSVAYVESAVMLYTALAVAWAMRTITRSPGAPEGSSTAGRGEGDLGSQAVRASEDTLTLTLSRSSGRGNQSLRPGIIAGIAAGFACGCKITCVPMLLLAVPVGMLLASLGSGWRKMILPVLAFGVAGSLVVSPWLLRNIVWAHNPIYPVAMSALGSDGMSPDQVIRFRIAHSPTITQQSPTHRLGVFWREVLFHWQYGWLILPAGLAALAVRWRDRKTILIFGTAAVVLIVWIGFTHLLGRFAVMLIPLAAVAIGQVEFRRWRLVLLALVVPFAVLCWSGVCRLIVPLTNPPPGNDAVIGRNLDFMTMKQIRDAVAAGKQVGFVGDAQTFLFQIPAAQLHYRSVFDVTPNVSDPIEAWLGPGVRGNPDWLLVINPSEIQRLHDTYHDMPAVPPQWTAHGPLTFFLDGDHPDKIIEPETGP
jgi:hypothetical protein